MVSIVTADLEAGYSGAMTVDSTRSGSWVSVNEPRPLLTLMTAGASDFPSSGRKAWDETSLGATIRARRDRLTPADAGLRREELAELAGVSVDYVVWLEQGRATTPSAQIVSALARALRLSVPERDHLYRLSGLRPPADGTSRPASSAC
jgi:DNA-binding XRE family transcriptional regulator